MALCGFALALRNRLQATTDVLSKVRGREERHGADRARDATDLDSLWQCHRKHQERNDQPSDERYTTDRTRCTPST